MGKTVSYSEIKAVTIFSDRVENFSRALPNEGRCMREKFGKIKSPPSTSADGFGGRGRDDNIPWLTVSAGREPATPTSRT
jgi:hypothetical protein